MFQSDFIQEKATNYHSSKFGTILFTCYMLPHTLENLVSSLTSGGAIYIELHSKLMGKLRFEIFRYKFLSKCNLCNTTLLSQTLYDWKTVISN